MQVCGGVGGGGEAVGEVVAEVGEVVEGEGEEPAGIEPASGGQLSVAV